VIGIKESIPAEKWDDLIQNSIGELSIYETEELDVLILEPIHVSKFKLESLNSKV
jgi:hypothetical protein